MKKKQVKLHLNERLSQIHFSQKLRMLPMEDSILAIEATSLYPLRCLILIFFTLKLEVATPSMLYMSLSFPSRPIYWNNLTHKPYYMSNFESWVFNPEDSVMKHNPLNETVQKIVVNNLRNDFKVGTPSS